MVESRRDVVDNILRACSVFIAVWTVSPPLQHPMIFRMLVVVASLIWIFMSMLKISKDNTGIFITYLTICGFIVLAIFIEYICGKGIVESIISQLQNVIFLLFLLQFVYYYKNDVAFLKILTVILFACLLVWQIRTLVEYEINPGVSRMLVRSSEDAIKYASMGVGGYGLIYPTIFTNMALMYLFGRVKGIKKVLIAIPLIIGIYLVFSAGFLIAVIMTLVSIICWISRLFFSTNVKTICLSFLLMLVLVFIAMELLLQYGDAIVSALDGTYYKVKVKEILEALRTDEVTGKLEGRTSRYLESFLGVFRYPIIGAKLLGFESDIGGHSALLDILGWFGIFGILYHVSIYRAIKTMFSVSDNKGLIIAVVLLFILNGVLNTIVGSHGIMFIVIPGALLFGEEKK